MKKQIIINCALIVALCAASINIFAQQAQPAKEKTKREKTKRESNSESWSSSGWGGEKVVGTGDVVTETRDVKDFTGVTSSISADIDLVQSSTFKVTVEGQKNILDLLETQVVGDKLKITFKKGYSMRYQKALKVHVEAPNFAYLGMAGSGNVSSNGALSGEKLEVSISGSGDFKLMQLQYSDVNVGISGSGDMNLGGSTERVEFKISGSGDLRAKELKAQTVNCRVSGSGNVACFAAKEFDAVVSGSGDVRYSGSPATVRKKVSGSGSIEAR
jgi:hypothetical protein